MESYTFITWREFAQILARTTGVLDSQCEPAGTVKFQTFGGKIRHLDITFDVMPRKICIHCDHPAHKSKCAMTVRDEHGEYQCLCPHSDPEGIVYDVWSLPKV